MESCPVHTCSITLFDTIMSSESPLPTFFLIRKEMAHYPVKSSVPLVTHLRADESPLRHILFRIHTVLTTKFPQLASNKPTPWLLFWNVQRTPNRIDDDFLSCSTISKQMRQLHQQEHQQPLLQQQFLWFQIFLQKFLIRLFWGVRNLLTPLFWRVPSCCLFIVLPCLTLTQVQPPTNFEERGSQLMSLHVANRVSNRFHLSKNVTLGDSEMDNNLWANIYPETPVNNTSRKKVLLF